MLGDNRGRTGLEDTIKLIIRDIREFDIMMSNILEGKTVEEVTDSYETNAKLIYDNYIKISKLMMQGLNYSTKNRGHWEFVFQLFGIMLKNIEEADALTYFEYQHSKNILNKWSLLKGSETNMEEDKDYFKKMKK